MVTTILFEERFEMPLDIGSLSDFRRWARSPAFPADGRVDFVTGRIEVDMSPEDLFTHGIVKTEILGVLWRRVKAGRLGHLFSDRTRVSSPAADLSAEPDIVFLSGETLDAGTVHLVPGSGSEEGRYVEIEGGPDLTVEIVRDSSATKDTARLPEAYHRAGTLEYWLVDARREQLLFRIHRRGRAGFEPVAPDPDGYQASALFDCAFRLDRSRDRRGHPTYDLQVREAPPS